MNSGILSRRRDRQSLFQTGDPFVENFVDAFVENWANSTKVATKVATKAIGSNVFGNKLWIDR